MLSISVFLHLLNKWVYTAGWELELCSVVGRLEFVDTVDRALVKRTTERSRLVLGGVERSDKDKVEHEDGDNESTEDEDDKYHRMKPCQKC